MMVSVFLCLLCLTWISSIPPPTLPSEYTSNLPKAVRNTFHVTSPSPFRNFLASVPTNPTRPSKTRPTRIFVKVRRDRSTSSSLQLFASAAPDQFSYSLLIFAGDVEANPGPTNSNPIKSKFKFPCGSCDKPVKSNQTGVLCDICNLWFYTMCVGLSTHLYNRLTPTDEWNCPNCALQGFNLDSSSTTDSQSLHSTQHLNESFTQPKSPSVRGLCFHLSNARSIRGKIPDLQALIASTNIDILALTETWLSPDVLDSELLPSEFSVFRTDRNANGGGVLLAVKKGLNPIKVSSPADAQPDLPFELLAVSCKSHNRKILLICVYSPPASDTSRMELLCNHLEAHSNFMINHDLTLLLGDFNLPDILWSTPPTPRSHVSEIFTDAMASMGLSQHVSEPTRQSNVLDLVFTDNPRLIKDVQTTDNLPNCDHHAVCGTLLLPSKHIPPPKRTFFSYDKTDTTDLASKLHGLPWNLALDEPDINTAWTLWKDLFLTTIYECIPNRSCRHNRKNPWISPTIIHASHVKRSLFRIAKNKNTTTAWTKYKHHCNSLRQITRTARSSFLNSLHTDLRQSPKRFWSYLKSKSRISPPSLFTSATGEPLTDETAITEEFNSHFHRCFTHSNPIGDIPDHVFDTDPARTELFDPTVSPSEVLEAIKTIKSDGACGPDGITPKMLKLSGRAISTSLAELFNLSLKSGSLPSEWKTALVVPIFKGGPNRSDVTAYRPISLTSVVGKILERIICKKMTTFSENNHLLPDSQFGFREKRSCTLQLIQSFHDWASSLDLPMPPDIHVIFLDWAKAFDSVPHDLLVLKLRDLGFSGSLLRWIADFLTERTQRVVHCGAKSSSLPVISGVPQGSVLGPLLFNLYISDLPASLSSTTSDSQFADDCYIHRPVTCPSDSRSLQNDLNTIVAWGEGKKLRLNTKKCQFLTITRRPNPIQYVYSIAGQVIPAVSSVKILGVILQSNLKWGSHITSITNKAYYALSLIRRTFGRSPGALTAFKAICLPILEYASPVWNPHLSQDNMKLEKVQRRFTNFLLNQSPLTANSPHHIAYEDRLKLFNLKSLNYRRITASLILLYKSLHSQVAINLPNFANLNSRHSFPTFLVKYARCNALKFSYFFNTTKLWNSLPSTIRSSSSLNTFRAAIKKLF